MTDASEFEEKVPFSIDGYLRHLHLIKEALQKDASREGLAYTADALAFVQNELDWTYRTDPTLPFLREFLIQLGDSLVTVEKLIPDCRKTQFTAIIEVLRISMNELTRLSKDMPRHSAPAPHIDILEREHRARTYGYGDTNDRQIYNLEAARYSRKSD